MKASGIFEHPGPRWFNIPAHRPFVRDLAQGLYEALSPLGPDALSRAVVLTPTRRGARTLADAFVTVAEGRAVLPPQIRPLGDLDEGEPPFEPGELAVDLPAAIEPLRRRFELARLVKIHESELGRTVDAAGALEYADAVAGFLDSLQIEEIAVEDRLDGLVSADLAEHWQVSRRFLDAMLTAWPARLAELGLVDVTERRVALLRRLGDLWDRAPPQGVLIAAGSTGTAPATADLLKVIARAPQGAVILPGLDDALADEAWTKVDEQHPQGAMRRLLERAGVDRGDVGIWPASQGLDTQGRWRRRVVNEALLPAESTKDWLKTIESLRREGESDEVDPIAEGLKGLTLLSARGEEEAATAAALLLREVVEVPGKTAALVAPDQGLARRVAVKLARWGVGADSSAGHALAGCAVGVLASLMARAAYDPLDPVTLLALVKHPLTRLGLDPETRTRRVQALELRGLRGARRISWTALEAGVAGQSRASEAEKADALALIATLRAGLERLAAPHADGPAPVAQAAQALAEGMEAFAADPEGDLGEMWTGAGGEAMARLLSGLMREAEGLPPVTARGFADLLARLLAGETVRTGGASHPRLHILGAIEARLTRADRLIVAGLEEGVWPQNAPMDPFLSRPMRKALGLPPPERRIGLAAHDFAQAACAPEVILLHTERREGAPSIKSRWLWRLETLARGAGVEIPLRDEVLDWARDLDRPPPGDYRPARRPAPIPPLDHRPRSLAVTRIEALTRDPYAVWARDILKLFPLERPDEAVEARARGTAIHAAFERFVLDHPSAMPPDAPALFEGLYLRALEAAGMPHEALAREAALARETAAWVTQLEEERRADGRSLHVEQSGVLTVQAAGGPFTLTAKADRIELAPGGFGHILDYKTGKAPTKKEVETGFSPQLTLTAAILAGGGFPGLGAPRPGDLTYLEVTGRRPAGKVEIRASAGDESAEAAARALEGLIELIGKFDQPDRPYLSRVAPQFVKAHPGDYDHLARVQEWSTSGEEGDGE